MLLALLGASAIMIAIANHQIDEQPNSEPSPAELPTALGQTFEGQNKLLTTINITPGGQTHIAVNPKTNMTYVSHFPSSLTQELGDFLSLSVINGTTNREEASIPLGGVASAIAVNSNESRNMVYVAVAVPNTFSNGTRNETWTNILHVIDGKNNNIVQNITIGTPTKLSFTKDMAVNPVTNRIYLVQDYFLAGKRDNILEIDDQAGEILSNVTTEDYVVEKIAVNPNKNKLYLITNNTNFYVINTTNIEEVKNMSLPIIPSDIDINSKTNNAYVTNL